MGRGRVFKTTVCSGTELQGKGDGEERVHGVTKHIWLTLLLLQEANIWRLFIAQCWLTFVCFFDVWCLQAWDYLIMPRATLLMSHRFQSFIWFSGQKYQIPWEALTMRNESIESYHFKVCVHFVLFRQNWLSTLTCQHVQGLKKKSILIVISPVQQLVICSKTSYHARD